MYVLHIHIYVFRGTINKMPTTAAAADIDWLSLIFFNILTGHSTPKKMINVKTK